jgi:hypothetical protein
MPDTTFELGNAIFCAPASWGCEVTPGYQAIAADSDGCWTGHKLVCQFNISAWKQTATYAQLQREMGSAAANVVPQFTWFGTAPSCSSNPCDVLEAGMLPITSSDFGSSSQCATGQKWLGMVPLLADQKAVVARGAQQCFAQDPARELTIQKALDMGEEIVKDLAAALTKVTGISPDVAQAGLRMKGWEGFRKPKACLTGWLVVLAILLFVAVAVFILKRSP